MCCEVKQMHDHLLVSMLLSPIDVLIVLCVQGYESCWYGHDSGCCTRTE